jgi:hypothetical protein
MEGNVSGGSSRWSGWIWFAGWLMILMGAVDVLEGVIAVVRQHYYVLTPTQIIVFDLKTWGWVTLIWGAVIALAGLGVLTHHAVARWFAVVVASLAVIEQLGFVGSSQYPLWALVEIAIAVVVIYALIVRWGEAETIA